MARIITIDAADAVDVFTRFLFSAHKNSIPDTVYDACVEDVTDAVDALAAIGTALGRLVANSLGTSKAEELAFAQAVCSAIMARDNATLTVPADVTAERQVKLYDEAVVQIGKYVGFYGRVTWAYRFDDTLTKIFGG